MIKIATEQSFVSGTELFLYIILHLTVSSMEAESFVVFFKCIVGIQYTFVR